MSSADENITKSSESAVENITKSSESAVENITKSSESAVENITRKIVFRSSDGEHFEMEEAVAFMSQKIKDEIEDSSADIVIPIHNVTGVILSKVIEYCKRHVDASASDEELRAFDADFVKVDRPTLFALIWAANYLNIKSLLDLGCRTVADMIKGCTPEEIRTHFDIKNNFTPQEEEEVRKNNPWAFE